MHSRSYHVNSFGTNDAYIFMSSKAHIYSHCIISDFLFSIIINMIFIWNYIVNTRTNQINLENSKSKFLKEIIIIYNFNIFRGITM